MSEQLYLRRCRKHQMNLAEAIDELICPYPPPDGHICDDFVVIDRKTGAVVNEVPEDEEAAPRARPAGSVDVTRTLGRSVSKKEQSVKQASGEKVQSKRKRGEAWPHGTPQRYYQEAKAGTGTCEACRKAASKYARDKRALRVATAGDQRVKATRSPKRVLTPRKVSQMVRSVSEGSGAAPLLTAMAEAIQSLRRQLKEREAAFAAAVVQILPDYKLLPTVEVEVVQAIADGKRGRAA